MDLYPETQWAESALVKIIETYVSYAEQSIQSKQLERYNLAVENYEKFLQLFPQSTLRGEVESHYLQAISEMQKLETVATTN